MYFDQVCLQVLTERIQIGRLQVGFRGLYRGLTGATGAYGGLSGGFWGPFGAFFRGGEGFGGLCKADKARKKPTTR